MITVKEKNLDQVMAGYAYIIKKPDDIQPGEALPTRVFFPGSWETASGKYGAVEGVSAMYRHGIPKYIKAGADFGRVILICVQIPNPKVELAVIDKIMACVLSYPNVDKTKITICGLSIGAMNAGQWMLSNLTRAKQVYGAILMSGSFQTGYTTLAPNVAGKKILMLGGSNDGQVPPVSIRAAQPLFVKAGAISRYMELPNGHDDNVWDYFNPQHGKLNVYDL